MNDVVIALVGLAGTLLIALIGVYGARKYNIGPNQEKLVKTLEDIVSAQETRIKILEEATQRIPYLEDEIRRLNNLTVSQVIKIQELELQLEQTRGV